MVTNTTIIVPGRPIPQGRARLFKAGPMTRAYYPKSSMEYRGLLVHAFLAHFKEVEWRPFLQTYVYVTAVGMRRGADGDNLLKMVMDALVTAGAFPNDDWEHVPYQSVLCLDGKPQRIEVELRGQGLPC